MPATEQAQDLPPAGRTRRLRALAPGVSSRGRLATFLLMGERMTQPTIDRFMSRSPQTIGQGQTLAAARRMMEAHGIRHLPVLEGGKLVGLVSQRDVQLLETMRDVDPEEVRVSEAMSQEAFAVSPKASLREVAAKMAEHKYGSAVVMEHDRVIGVFTTVDALHALSSLLEDLRSP